MSKRRIRRNLKQKVAIDKYRVFFLTGSNPKSVGNGKIPTKTSES